MRQPAGHAADVCPEGHSTSSRMCGRRAHTPAPTHPRPRVPTRARMRSYAVDIGATGTQFKFGWDAADIPDGEEGGPGCFLPWADMPRMDLWITGLSSSPLLPRIHRFRAQWHSASQGYVWGEHTGWQREQLMLCGWPWCMLLARIKRGSHWMKPPTAFAGAGQLHQCVGLCCRRGVPFMGLGGQQHA